MERLTTFTRKSRVFQNRNYFSSYVVLDYVRYYYVQFLLSIDRFYLM